MPDESHFWAAVCEAPGDPVAKPAFADWLAERGRDNLAHALRWCAARGRHPSCSPKGRSVYWQREARGTRGAFNLPGPVFDLLRMGKRRSRVIRVYRSPQAAFEALAVALARLRALWEAPVAGPVKR